MSSNPCDMSSATEAMAAVLPADGSSLATALSGTLMLVAHTGSAHLGVPVDRTLLQGLARAQGIADGAFYGGWARERWAGSACPTTTEADPSVAFLGLPATIPLRHATSHSFAVSGTDIHLMLHAARDPVRPEVHVELRLDRGLIAQLAQHQHRLIRRAHTVAVVAVLFVAGVFLALAACAT
jgi:hypothetical protein